MLATDLKRLNEAYALKLEERINEIEAQNITKIGFIGEFSTGKTSLINSVLGTNLPIDVTPTTKAICLIETVSGITENMYFKEVNFERSPIGWQDFQAILNGNSSDAEVAVMQIPSTPVLPAGYVFVDTPGIASIGSINNEASLTYDYLSLLDVAVVCININDGTLKESVKDFICRPELRMIQDRVFFALTHSDLKPNNNEVRNKLISDLTSLNSQGKFNINNPKTQILTTSSKDTNNAEKLLEIFTNTIFAKKANIIAQRKSKDYIELAHYILKLLSAKEQSLEYSDDKILTNTIKQCRTAIEALENECKEKENTFNLSELEILIADLFKSSKSAFIEAKDNKSRAVEFNAFQEELQAIIECKYRNYAKTPLSMVLSSGFKCLESRMQSIDRIKDCAVTIATMAATAIILPAGGALGNAIEAAAGGVAKKATSKAIVMTTRSFVGKAINDLGRLFETINPVEWLGSWIAESSFFKGGEYDEWATMQTRRLTIFIGDGIKSAYREENIEPLRIELAANEERLKELRQEEEQNISKFVELKDNLHKDVEKLKSLIA